MEHKYFIFENVPTNQDLHELDYNKLTQMEMDLQYICKRIKLVRQEKVRNYEHKK